MISIGDSLFETNLTFISKRKITKPALKTRMFSCLHTACKKYMDTSPKCNAEESSQMKSIYDLINKIVIRFFNFFIIVLDH